jgi:hypothetical protein
VESVKKVSIDDLLNDTPADAPSEQSLKVWNDEPGGTVVERFADKGTKYVLVEFENSPGIFYTYLG